MVGTLIEAIGKRSAETARHVREVELGHVRLDPGQEGDNRDHLVTARSKTRGETSVQVNDHRREIKVLIGHAVNARDLVIDVHAPVEIGHDPAIDGRDPVRSVPDHRTDDHARRSIANGPTIGDRVREKEGDPRRGHHEATAGGHAREIGEGGHDRVTLLSVSLQARAKRASRSCPGNGVHPRPSRKTCLYPVPCCSSGSRALDQSSGRSSSTERRCSSGDLHFLL